MLLFLSHAGPDTDAARRLKQRIETAPEARARGLRVWLDKDDLRPGERWQSQLEDAIGKATAFAVYIGSKGVMNWVEAEVNLGLSRAISGNPRIPFISILAREATGSSALPGFARQFQLVREVETNPEEFKRLLAAVLGGAEAGTLQLEEEPFFGLKTIDETRSHLFFGRERETEELVKRLSATRLLMVTGDSGSGKSSLVRAGLVPRWRGGALARHPGQRAAEEIWHVIEMRPRGNPRRALGEAVFDAAGSLGLAFDERGILQKWAAEGSADEVRNALRCGLTANRTRTLMVVDQFEELWTLTPPEQRQSFVALLDNLSDPSDPSFAVVLTMRRDYYNLCSEFPELYQRLEADDRRARYVVERMRDADLRRIVTEPLKLAGVEEAERDALAQCVLQDVRDRPGDLALMQFALTETWHRRYHHENNLLRAYVWAGRVEGALARAAERVYEHVLREEYEESEIEAVFIRLVRLGDTAGATRRLARRREFDERRWAMLQILTGQEHRVVLISGGEGDERAEIAHEALVTQWPRFQRWLQAAAGDKRTLEALIERAAGWATASDHEAQIARLATGAERQRFTALSQARPHWLSAVEQEFVQESEAFEEKRIAKENRLKEAVAAWIDTPNLIGAPTGASIKVDDIERREVHSGIRNRPASMRAPPLHDEREAPPNAQARKLFGGRVKPVIFISYSHKDEPEHASPHEIQWLSFVYKYLQPAIKHGIFEVWVDRDMPGGSNWNAEIERKLHECDVFILLVSANSMAADYIIDKEISIIRKRQSSGDPVHFYPLLLTPTPKAGLEKVMDKNLRPRDAKPFSAYEFHDRAQHMANVADEIAELVETISGARGVTGPASASTPEPRR